MVRVTRLPTVLSFVFNPKIDSHQRAIMLGLVSLICLSLFHYLWLWNRLLENNESSFWLCTGDDPWVQDVKKVLQCRKSPRHSWYSIDTARALYSRPPAKRQQSSSSSSSSSQAKMMVMTTTTRTAPCGIFIVKPVKSYPTPTCCVICCKLPFPCVTTLDNVSVELWVAPARDVGLVQALDGARDVSPMVGWKFCFGRRPSLGRPCRIALGPCNLASVAPKSANLVD